MLPVSLSLWAHRQDSPPSPNHQGDRVSAMCSKELLPSVFPDHQTHECLGSWGAEWIQGWWGPSRGTADSTRGTPEARAECPLVARTRRIEGFPTRHWTRKKVTVNEFIILACVIVIKISYMLNALQWVALAGYTRVCVTYYYWKKRWTPLTAFLPPCSAGKNKANPHSTMRTGPVATPRSASPAAPHLSTQPQQRPPNKLPKMQPECDLMRGVRYGIWDIGCDHSNVQPQKRFPSQTTHSMPYLNHRWSPESKNTHFQIKSPFSSHGGIKGGIMTDSYYFNSSIS